MVLMHEIGRNRFIHRQSRRKERACIYEQHAEYGVIGYEVFLIKTRKGRVVKGNVLQPTEQLPSNEAFKKWARSKRY
jgi:hypothetical protein